MRRPAHFAAIAISLALAAPAVAHEGNPDYESLVTGVSGARDLKVQVVNGDDSLLLINEGSEPVVVEGYDGEPYARLHPDGRVEVNQRSSATYLNEERFGGVDIPSQVDPKAEPQWKRVATNGRFTFHDHRIHWMNENEPPKITDESQRQKVFDWKVPVQAGDASGSINGTLWWRGKDDGAPVATYVAGGAIVLASIAFVVIVRRRRRMPAGVSSGESPKEAW
jgi:hypothetical protein